MTNEEWFYGLNTEEKAKTMLCLVINSMDRYKRELTEGTDVDEIVKWLKEEHHE